MRESAAFRAWTYASNDTIGSGAAAGHLPPPSSTHCAWPVEGYMVRRTVGYRSGVPVTELWRSRDEPDSCHHDRRTRAP
jgi:hypothetical protein